MKKLILFYLQFCTFFINMFSFSQSNWSFFYSSPTTNNYNCVKFINKNTGFISGAYGTLLKTTNAGVNWTFIETNSYFPVTYVFPVNNSVVYYITSNPNNGQGSNLYKSVNGGLSWQNIKHFTNHLRALYFLDDNNGYAAGDGGAILYTTDGGLNWIDRSSSIYVTLQQIQFINSQTGYIASFNTANILLKTTNGGLNWNNINIDNNSYYSSFYFRDSNTGIVCGGSMTFVPPPPFPGHTDYQEKIFKTTNGGINWTTSLFGTSGIFRTLSAYNNNVFVFGEASSKKSSDFGITWANLGFSITPTPRFSHLIDSTEGFAVGDNGRIAKINNSLYASNQNYSLSSYPVYSIHFTNVNTGFALTADPQLTGGSQIYKTTNSGNTWNQCVSVNNEIVKNLMFANNNYGIANGSRELLLTSNAGFTWNQVWYPVTVDINSSIILPNGYAYAVGDSGLFVYNNNFTSWNSYRIPNVGDLMDIKFPDPNTGYILNNGNILLKSVNAGLNWGSFSLPFSNIKCMYFLNANIGFISANSGSTIYKTSNGGWNWNSIYSENTKAFSKLYFLDSLKAFGFNDLNYNIEYTLNGGANWTTVYLHYSNLPFCINFANQLTGFLGGYYGTLFRTTNGGTIWAGSNGIQLPTSFSLSQNYPNPFNPSTNIKYQIINNKLVILKIYDILGKEIETLVNEKQSPGTYEVTWNAANYPSGVYFYKLETGDFTETKKMILLK